MTSGFPTRRSVSPGCPFCPPVFLPERSRRLVVRGGFFNPSLEGGLPLLLLFNPRRRSSSATRALAAASSPFNATICEQQLNLLNQPLDVGGSLHPTLESDSPLRHQLLHTTRVNSPHCPPERTGISRIGHNRSGYLHGY